MEWIFVILALFAWGYGAGVFFYVGLTSFLWFWPLFGCVNLLMAFLLRRFYKRKKEKKPLNLQPYVFMFTSYAIGVVGLLVMLGLIFSDAHSREQSNLDYVIVLGTELDRSSLSADLEHRLERVIRYHDENPNTIFVLSGGKGPFDRSTEATVMYYYLVQRGVPANRLLLEFYSTSTLEKVRFSQLMLQEDAQERRAELPKAELSGVEVLQAERRPLSIGMLTGDFNMFRAMSIARRYKMKHVYPMVVSSDRWMSLHFFVREAAAIFKDRLVGNM